MLDIPGTFAGQVSGSDKAVDWENARFKSRVPKSNPRFVKMIKSRKKNAKLWTLGGGLGGLLSGYLFGGSETHM